ncbi:MAG TPA: hypothetical protein VF514_07020 [Bacteroidota bacterium]
MKGLRLLLAVLVAGIGLVPGLHAQDSASAVVTNLRAYQSLAASLGDSLANLLPATDSVRVTVRIAPPDVAWFLQDAVERPFRGRNCVISANDSSRYGVEFGVLEMHVHYSNLRREGIFGSRVLDRMIVLQARLRLVDRVAGTVGSSGERMAVFSDTIGLSQVERIEHAAVPVTRGTIPPEDFFSGIVEPLIMVGAVAVAIFLLFTVRS